MKYLAIKKTTGKSPKDFNKWIQYIHRESNKINHLIKKQS
jgi:hypothetical protein